MHPAGSQDDLAALLALTKAVNGTLDLSEVCQEACRIACQQLKADHVAFALFDPDLKFGRVVAEFPDLGNEKGARFQVSGVPVEDQLLASMQPTLVGVDEADRLGLVKTVWQRFGIESSLLVPVIGRDGTVLGSFGLDILVGGSRTEGEPPFDKRQLDLCKIFAGQIALAVDNARIHGESRQRLAESMLLLEASTIVGRESDAAAAYAELADLLRARCAAASCRVLTIDPSNRCLAERAFAKGDTFLAGSPADDFFDLSRWGTLKAFLETGKATAFASTSFPPWLSEWMSAAGYDPHVAFLTMAPLRVGEELVGLVEISELADIVPLMETSRRELLFAVTHQLTALVDRLRLREIAERRARLHQKLEEFYQQMLLEQDDGMLRWGFVKFALDMTGWQGGAIYRYSFLGNELNHFASAGDFERPAGSLSLPYGRGLIGTVAQQGVDKIVYDYALRTDREFSIPENSANIALAIPIMPYRDLDSVLFLYPGRKNRLYLELDREILVRYAARCASVLGSLPIRHPELMKRDLEALQVLNEKIRTEHDIEGIAFHYLTAITGMFGLRFNRAILFAWDPEKRTLQGIMGVGDLSHGAAQDSWHRDDAARRNTLRWFEEARYDRSKLSPLGVWSRSASIPVAPDSPIANVVQTCRPAVQPGWQDLPAPYRERMQPVGGSKHAGPVIALAPLIGRRGVIGLTIVDNEFTGHAISERDLRSLAMFSDAAAVAIDNERVRQAERKRQDQLAKLFEASARLPGLMSDPDELLNEAIRTVQDISQARCAALVQYDAEKNVQLWRGWRPDKALAKWMEEYGKHLEPEGEPTQFKLSEKTGTSTAATDADTACLLPWAPGGMVAGGKLSGWLWTLHSADTQRIETRAAQFYLNQAANVYDSALRIHFLAQLHRVSAAMAPDGDVKQATDSIAREALELFRADLATVWPYDKAQDKFTPQSQATAGLTPIGLKEPSSQGIARSILATGYDRGFSPDSVFLRNNQLASFQGVRLDAGKVAVGVLFLSYHSPRVFMSEDRRKLESFAALAGLALQRANLREQVGTVQNAADVAAELTKRQGVESTLKVVADKTQRALQCDIVTLFSYDQDSGDFGFPPTMAGDVHRPDLVEQEDREEAGKILQGALAQTDDILICESAAEQPEYGWLFNNRFSRDEGISSSLVSPLRVADRNVGLMFVDYRSPQRFAAEDLANMRLFAKQAAIAIRNVQLYRELGYTVELQREAIDFSGELLKLVDEQRPSLDDALKILDKTVERAQTVLNVDRSSVVLRDEDGSLRAKATRGWDKDEVGGALEPESHSAYTLRIQMAVPVLDFRLEKRFHPHRILAAGIISGVAVPIPAFGVLLVHSKTKRFFSEAEQRFLLQIANAAAIAYRRALAAAQYRLQMRQMLHELHSLYPSTKNFAEALLRNSDALPPEQQKQVKLIFESAWEADRVLRNVPAALTEEPVPPKRLEDVRQLVEKTVSRVRETAALYAIEIKTVPAEDTMEAEVSEELIKAVIHNLLSNAIRFMPNGGVVTVKTAQRGQDIQVTVSDNGPGIPAAEQDRIFDPFYRSPVHQNLSPGGTGLGLSVARKLVEQYHRGRIWVESTEGHGSSFHFTVPIRQELEIAR